MKDKSTRAEVRKANKVWVALPPDLPVARVLEGKRPENEHRTFFKEELRLVIPLEGTGRCMAMENGREMLFDLQPGRALFLAPCRWTRPLSRMIHRTSAMTLRPDSAHGSDTSLSRERLAEILRRYPNHLSRFVNQHTKQGFRSYLNEIRPGLSLRSLRYPRYNATDAAPLRGFTALQYFIRCFRERFGFTAGEFRKRTIESMYANNKYHEAR